MKFRRDTGSSVLPGFSGGTNDAANDGSYGSEASPRTPYTFCTRRSVGSPLSSQPIG